MLFVHFARAGFARPNWQTATHNIIEQQGNRIVVETTVLWGSWHRVQPGQSIDYAYPFEMVHYFTFIDGKINDMDGGYIFFVF